MQPPEGRVTFLFTDIEGSTKLLHALGPGYAAVLARHHALLHQAIERHGGHVMGTEGDAFAVAFARPEDAVATALDAQLGLLAEPWGDHPVRVRMGIHTGPVVRNETGYVGMALHETARISAAAHGGQIVVSPETERRAVSLPREIGFRSLGAHRLKDLPEALTLFQVVHPDLGVEFPPLRSLPAVISTLPRPRTTFLGRSAEVDAVRAAVASARLVTLVGPGGAGKTRLAIECVAPMRATVRDGIWFVDLAGIAEDDAVLGAWAAALDLRPEHDALGTIVEFLRTLDGIIVADNCEHVIAAAAEVVDAILDETTGIRVVATSRELLRISGEVPVAVGALDGRDAEELFAQRAAEARPGYRPSTDEQAAIARICETLDRLPLAVELAAARAGTLGAREIETHLQGRFTLLTNTRRGGAERHRTLHAAIRWSYDLLPRDVQAVFRRIAVLPHGFSLDPASVAACADPVATLDALGQLVEKSLLNIAHTEDGAQYSMLKSVQSFALEMLAGGDDIEAAWRRLLAWTTGLAAQFDEGMRASGWRAPLALLQAHRKTVGATTRWALASGEVEAAARIVGDLERFWMLDRDYIDGMSLCLEVSGALPDETESLTQARAVVAAARAVTAVGASTQAVVNRARSAVARWGDSDPSFVAYRVQGTLDGLLVGPGPTTDTAGLEEAEATLRSAAGAHSGIDVWVTMLSVARCWHRLDPGREAALVAEVSEIADALDHDLLRYFRFFSTGFTDDAAAMLEHVPDALEIARRLGAPLLIDACTSSIGRALLLTGDYEAAAPFLAESEEFCRRTGDRYGYLDVLRNRVRLLLWAGDLAAAVAKSDELVALTERLFGEEDWAISLTSSQAAVVMVAAGRFDDADRHADRFEAVSAPNTMQCLDLRATIARERGDRSGALRLLRQAADLAQSAASASSLQPLVLAFATVAALLSPTDVELAARLFGAAGPRSSWGIPWRLRLDEAIETTRASLGDERYEKLYAAGSAMTLEEAIAMAL